jgi:predicted nuclease of restriction endonuclease-like (RecB) superfamily
MKQKSELIIPPGYAQFLTELKAQIQAAQTKAMLAVNRELVLLYWQIGKRILERQEQAGWGAKVVTQLAKDLSIAFPTMKGLSRTNLLYMRSFAKAYPDEQIVQQAAGQLPWFHNCVLLDKVKDPKERDWYARACTENGWSRAVLEHQIESKLFERQGKAISNFKQTLPAPQSELVQQLFRDPMNFEFLSLSKEALERDLEQSLIGRLKDFMLELGVGFSFVGSQYHLEVDGEDFYLDLLFYHLRLRCFVIIDLKMTDFKPDYAGKMSFYLTAVDELLRHESDKPSIGLILCKSKKKTIVEWSVRNMTKAMAIAEYRTLPKELEGILPTVEQLEAELNKEFPHEGEGNP